MFFQYKVSVTTGWLYVNKGTAEKPEWQAVTLLTDKQTREVRHYQDLLAQNAQRVLEL